jgi:hypothetical protein
MPPFVLQHPLVGDAAVEALGGENAEFRFRHVEPTPVFWCVVPLEPFDEPAGFGGGKGFVERSWLVRVQVVLDEHDFTKKSRNEGRRPSGRLTSMCQQHIQASL